MKARTHCSGLLLLLTSAWSGLLFAATIPAPPPGGIDTISNPLNNPPNDLATLFPTAEDGDLVFRFAKATQSYKDPYTYIAGFGWFSSNGDDPGPNGPVLLPGEGAFYQKTPSAVATTFTFTGAPVPGTYPTITPGLFCLISRKICADTPTPQENYLGTFENMTGGSPFNCKPLVIYKFNPTAGGPFSSQSGIAPFIPYTFRGTPGTWSPEPPLLELGRAVFLQVKTTFTPGCPAPFQVSGAVPNRTNNCPAATAVKIFVTGCGFLPGAMVTLKKGGTTLPPSGSAPFIVDCSGTVLGATFNLAGASPGTWMLRVKQGATTKTTPIVIKACGTPDLRLQWLGLQQIPLVTGPQTYVLAYRNIALPPADITSAFNINVNPPPACITRIPPGPNYPVAGGNLPVVAGAAPKYKIFTLQASCGSPMSFNMKAMSVPSYGAARTLRVGVGQFPLALRDDGLPSSASAYKLGSAGEGSAHYLSAGDDLNYFLHLENGAGASNSVQDVSITEQLNADQLDISTFNFGPITLGTNTVEPPAGLHSFTTNITYAVDDNPARDITVQITAALVNNPIDPNYGHLSWTMRALDPMTGERPTDATRGFLPPNIAPPASEGYLLYSVQPHLNLEPDEVIGTPTKVTFDNQEPMEVPAWLNTLDVTAPECQMVALPSFQTNSDIALSWSATDHGAGVASYTIYVSQDGGEYTAFLTDTLDTTATYKGEPNHSYRFYCAVTDQVGNVEEPDADVASIQTTILSSTVLGISQASDQVTVCWPLPGTGYLLEEVDHLNELPATNWALVPLPYQTNDTHIFITVPVPVGNKFYRLRTP